MSKTDKDFDILVGNLLFAYKQLCLNEVIHEMVKTEYYRKFRDTWNMILLSLERGYLLELAKIFDQANKRPKDTISIYYFLDFEFKDHSATINSINKLRNKVLDHIDLQSARNPEEFMKKLNLKRSNLASLFNKTIEVVEKLKEHFGLTQDLRLYFQEERSRIRGESKRFTHLFHRGEWSKAIEDIK